MMKCRPTPPRLKKREDRVPTIAFPRKIPFDGDPADNHTRVQIYSDWLTESDLLKLLINTTEGHALIGLNREFCRTWKNQKEITLNGKHYLQEDSPDELGQAIAEWIPNL
jgi:haloalkane dehalogenase